MWKTMECAPRDRWILAVNFPDAEWYPLGYYIVKWDEDLDLRNESPGFFGWRQNVEGFENPGDAVSDDLILTHWMDLPEKPDVDQDVSFYIRNLKNHNEDTHV